MTATDKLNEAANDYINEMQEAHCRFQATYDEAVTRVGEIKAAARDVVSICRIHTTGPDFQEIAYDMTRTLLDSVDIENEVIAWAVAAAIEEAK